MFKHLILTIITKYNYNYNVLFTLLHVSYDSWIYVEKLITWLNKGPN
jgi:hypothetical protein